MKKRIVLCADDYGQALTISQGILELLKHKRLSAVSCMTNALDWSLQGAWLLPFVEQVDIGLHFNLTEGKALSSDFIREYGETFPSLMTVLRQSFLRQWQIHLIEKEWHAQLDAFEHVFKRLPRFVDGHQHIQQFPVIREALLRVYEDRLRPHNTYVRSLNFKLTAPAWIKKYIIYRTGAPPFLRLLEEHHIPHNTSFSGIYTFSGSSHYAKLFPAFLAESKDRGLIMCHPGLEAKPDAKNDTISKARFDEYHYLSSELFLEDLSMQEVDINQF